ncbi:MAG: hypothetical protein GY795_41585 [Desulfobacterales bacterium]|nr:hypothetical protein [Desulfobacterales bacterium]
MASVPKFHFGTPYYEEAYASRDYLPDELHGHVFYTPTDRGYEKIIKQRLDKWRSLEYLRKSSMKFLLNQD